MGLDMENEELETKNELKKKPTKKTKEMLDDMHKRKIDMADSIYVINVDGYIGDSTRSEIEYAIEHGKSVSYLEEGKRYKEESRYE